MKQAIPEQSPQAAREPAACGSSHAGGGALQRDGASALPPRQRTQLNRIAQLGASAAQPPAAAMHKLARQGTAGASGALPHFHRIQSSFGRHDISQVQAHTDAAAASSAHQMGARAFASGNHIGFAHQPSLHTAAHEAAHVIQQRAGVQLAGGVGTVGDRHERHADAVADAVVAGRSAEPLLSQNPVSSPPRPEMRNASGGTALALLRAQPSDVPGPPQLQLGLANELIMDAVLNWELLKKLSLRSLLHCMDDKLLVALNSYATFRQVYDTVLSVSNGLTLALSIWDGLPVPVRTTVLFLTGRLMAAIPMVDAMAYAENYLVDADQDGHSTHLVQVLARLKLVLQAVKSPVSSAVEFSKYLYSSWWSGGDDSSGEERSVSPSSRRADLAKLDLGIIWLNVKALHLERTEKNENGQKTQQGGMHADFALGVHLFNFDYTPRENDKLRLILPWAGGVDLLCNAAVRLGEPRVHEGLFTLTDLDMTLLELSDEGLQALAFSLGELSIGRDVLTMRQARASYSQSDGMKFAGTMGLRIYGWDAHAQLDLQLDKAGNFEGGLASNIRESSGTLTVDQARLGKSEGFTVSNAKINLEPSTNLALRATLQSLAIKEGSASGSAVIEAGAFDLLGNRVRLVGANGEINYRTLAIWDATAQAKLVMDFEHIEAAGEFAISHNGAKGETDLQLNNGSFSAEYEALSVSAKGLNYDHRLRRFHLDQATVDIKALDTQAEVKGVSIDAQGLSFEQATIAHPTPIKPFEGLTLNNALITLVKHSEQLSATASADLDVHIVSPMATGQAKGIRLTLDKTGLIGSVETLSLQTTPFRIDIKGATLDKEGLRVEQATLLLNTGGDSDDDAEARRMIPELKPGLLSFVPIDNVGVQVIALRLDRGGLHIGQFRPILPPLRFKAFGLDAEVNFSEMQAKVSAGSRLSLDKLTGLPLKAELAFPVFPGIELYGYLAAHADVGLGFELNAGAAERHWAVGGELKVDASIGLSAGLGVQVGSQALLALSVGAFARGEAKLVDARAPISGKVRYDRKSSQFSVLEPLQIRYDFDAKAVVSVGLEMKAKALFFYEKTLYRYTATQWCLGSYQLSGALGDKGGELEPGKAGKLGLQDNKTRPAPTEQLDESSAAQALRSDVPIVNGGEARLELLKQEASLACRQLRELHETASQAKRDLEQLKAKYLDIIQSKDALFHAQASSMSAAALDARLLEFNRKHGVETLQQRYAHKDDLLKQAESSINAALKKLEQLQGSEASALELGASQSFGQLSEQQKQASSIRVEGPGTLDDDLEVLKSSIQEEASRPSLKLEEPQGVMSLRNFVSNTTTSSVFGNTTRKTITVVDKALENYHAARNRETLQRLLGAIQTYLDSHTSRRVPYVLLLKSQVQTALLNVSDQPCPVE